MSNDFHRLLPPACPPIPGGSDAVVGSQACGDSKAEGVFRGPRSDYIPIDVRASSMTASVTVA